MSEEKLKINIKLMTSTLSVEVDKTATVLNVKEKVKEQMGAEIGDQKLVYKGRIMNDSDSLEALKIQSGDCLHLVVKKKPVPTEAKPEIKTEVPPATGAVPPTANPWGSMGMPGMGMPGMGMPGMGMPGMGMPGGGLNSAMLSQGLEMMMAHPEMLQMAIASNPMLQQMTQSNPEIMHMLSNPDMLRSIMTPENIQMAMGMMQNMRGIPGANPFAPMMGPAPTTGTDPSAAPGTAPPPNPYAGMDMGMLAQMMGGMPPAPAPTTAPSTTAPSTDKPTGSAPTVPPAPSSIPPSMGTGAYGAPPGGMSPFDYMSLFGGVRPPVPTGIPRPVPTGPPMDPKEKYAIQLAKMKEMGFTNEEVNLDALKATNGIIDAAIERIINMIK